MRYIVFVLALFYIQLAGFSQGSYNPLNKPNTYQSAENENYWKNKTPFPGYWQQDVHYEIKAIIDEQTDQIKASLRLVYQNNSPDDLDFVFFHLYQNAFQPGSYYDDLQLNNKVKPQYGPYENLGLGTKIEQLKVDGKQVNTTLDNTILKVNLPTTLKAGASCEFEMDFTTYFDQGSVRRRMKKFDASGFTHYDGVHWYPRMAVYDRKFGWTTDQHLGREFYGDFGTFDVALDFASNYVVEATGFLTNRSEVLPKELRERLDISNFLTGSGKVTEITPYHPKERKTWVFHAENVHDFAFTADPTYRIGEAEWNGVKCIALVQEPNARGWKNAAEYTANIIKTYSEDFGKYTYHKMVVADARDGMEYPMLTLDGGSDPGYRGLLAHEIGHNWFFGQVGSNETYRAAMDEGFTQFLTAWCLEAIDGDTMVEYSSKSKYRRVFKEPTLVKDRSVYYGYYKDAIEYKDASLNTHSDGFDGALRHGGGYSHVYYKTATMLYNLQYVLGDSLFIAAMQHYFQQWKIAHPYMEDFRNSIIQYTHADLNWFFDQWFETTKRIDYGIKKVKRNKKEGYYLIDFKRNGRMQMPLDFTVETKSGRTLDYHIPNTWFVKDTKAEVLDRWIGWDKLKPTYRCKIEVTEEIKNIEIDPSHRLADVNQLDNRSNNFKLAFDHRIHNYPSPLHYEGFIRPDVWYNAYDGLKMGVHFNGDYMNITHKLDFNIWYNTGLLQQNIFLEDAIEKYDPFSFRINYSNPSNGFIRNSDYRISAKFLDGLWGGNFGFYKRNEKESTELYAYYKLMYRSDVYALNYLVNTGIWRSKMYNNSVNIGVHHSYHGFKGKGAFDFLLRSSSMFSDYQYAYLRFELKHYSSWKKIQFRTRCFAQYGKGRLWAEESKLYASGASSEELMDNKYTRSVGFFDQTWLGYGQTINHFHMGGGLNLRGYSGYLAPYENADGEIALTFNGTTGASVNFEADFTQLAKLRQRWINRNFGFNVYGFYDAGVINSNLDQDKLALADFRMDAGLGATFTIKQFGPLEKVNPLVIRADFPLFVNRLPLDEENFISPRWVVGLNYAW